MKYVWFYRGKRYEMTEDQVEAAYRFRQRQYRMVDAKAHLEQFIYGDETANMSEFDIQYQEECFTERYKITPADAFGMLDKIVSRHDLDADCNLDENAQWENAIRNVITGT